MKVVIVRHTSVNVPAGTCYGQSDVPLNDTFEEEAEEVRKKLKAYEPFDAAFTSPLSRCVKLAERCGHGDAVRDERLMELNFGDWEMKRYVEIDDPRLDLWYEDYINFPAGGGESFVMQVERVSRFFDELSQKEYERVVVFAHGGILVAGEVYTKKIRIEDSFSEVPPYGCVMEIEI